MEDDVTPTTTAAATLRPARRSDATTVVGVGLGGSVGAAMRWLVAEPFRATPPVIDAFPWPTFVVNVVGCLLIGLASVWIPDQHRMRPVLVTGVLGGFTTMSAFAVELNELADGSRDGVAAIYLAATLAVGAGAVLVGETLAGGRRAVRTSVS